MIDWNNDGKNDEEDIIMTEFFMDDDEQEWIGSEKPNGSCLMAVLYLLVVPVTIICTVAKLV